MEFDGLLSDYISLQYYVMDLISRGRDVSWELKGQELIVKEGRKYDKLEVVVKGINGNPMPLQLENHYFDITKCINVLVNEDEEGSKQLKKRVSLYYGGSLEKSSL